MKFKWLLRAGGQVSVRLTRFCFAGVEMSGILRIFAYGFRHWSAGKRCNRKDVHSAVSATGKLQIDKYLPMGDFLMKIFAWAFSAVFFLSLTAFVIWIVRSIGNIFSPRDRVKVYYDDNDHSKGHYYVGKPGGTYPVGYPKEQIVREMEAYEQLKRKQEAKRRHRNAGGSGYSLNKFSPMWLQILFMTPSEYMQYRRKKKEAKNQNVNRDIN